MKSVSILSALVFGLPALHCFASTIEVKTVDDATAANLISQLDPNGSMNFSIKPFVRLDQWDKAAYGIEAKYLKLFPEQKNPIYRSRSTGETKEEPIMVGVFKASFAVSKPASSIDLKAFLFPGGPDGSLQFAKAMDQGMEHRLPKSINTGEKRGKRSPNFVWCENKRDSVCVESVHKYSKVFKMAIGNINQELKRNSEDGYSDSEQIAQSELRVIPTSEVEKMQEIETLTGVNTTISSIAEQNVFYFNQISDFMKSIIIVQPSKKDHGSSIVTMLFAAGIESKIFHLEQMIEKRFPTLSYLLPLFGNGEQALLGESTYHLGVRLKRKAASQSPDESIEAGLPYYLRPKVRIAAEMLRK